MRQIGELSKMNRLDSYFKIANEIDEHTEQKTFEIHPRELINHRRIDIIVKYYYIRARETGGNIAFAEEIYKKHIEAFTRGTFREKGNLERTTIEQYITTFNVMIDHFKEEGFDEAHSIIPIGRHNEVLSEAHRTACALYFDTPVRVMKFPGLSVDYGVDFFRKRLLDELYLDFIAKAYVQLKNDVAVALIWPKAGNKEMIKYIEKELTKEQIEIAYQKRLRLSEKNVRDLVYSLYREEHWIGLDPEKCEALNLKTEACYDQRGELVVYLLEGMEDEKVKRINEKIRGSFQIETSSIHTIQLYDDKMETLNLLLNKNYAELLQQNYMERKDANFRLFRFFCRKFRYYYRQPINQIKGILRKNI